jgi:hypothetical protein
MSLSDNLRRLARERIPTRAGEPAKRFRSDMASLEYGALSGGHIALNCLAHWFGNNHGGPIHKAGRGTGDYLI